MESLELNGYDYLWKLVLSATDESVARDITEYLLKVSFIDTSAKLKKDAHDLHKQFIEKCFHQLKAVTEVQTAKSKMSTTIAVQQGYELETCTEESALTRLRNRSSTEEQAHQAQPLIHDKPSDQRTQIIRRLINLLERYVSVVEEAHPGKRQIPAHAATFLGQPLTLKVGKVNDSKKEELEIQCHSNEMIGALKKRVAEKLQQSVSDLQFESSVSHGGNLGSNKDGILIGSLLKNDQSDTWSVTVNATSSTSTALMVFDDNAVGEFEDKNHKYMIDIEREKNLPGVMMSNGDQFIFPMLYKLSATSKDSATLTTLSKLFHKIPTDTNVIEEFESIEIETSQSSGLAAAADASPKISPRKAFNRETAAETIHKLLDPHANGMSALRVWYNLSVLSSLLFPQRHFNVSTNAGGGNQEQYSLLFTQQFHKANGLKAVLQLFEKDYLPPDTEQDMRQSIYVLALQVTRFLLCGQPMDNVATAAIPSTSMSYGRALTTSSPMMKPTPPKKTALDASAASPLAMSATRAVQTMSEDQFLEMVTMLMGLAWSSSVGDFQFLATSRDKSIDHGGDRV